jgi:signal transduction histidine kinase
MPRRPRLRTVLLIVNLLILSLPVGGIAALRLYENELVRRTEGQLLVQGVVLREAFRQELRREVGRDPVEKPSPVLEEVAPRLDVATERVRPRAPDAQPAPRKADPVAAAAGARLAPLVERAGHSTLVGIRVVDDRGVVVATSRTELGLSLAHREEVARALRGESVSLMRERISDEPPPPLQSASRGQRYRIFVALPVVEDDRVVGAVILSRTPLDIAKALYLMRRPLIIGTGVLLAVVVLVSALTSFTVLRPVRALIRQAESVSRGGRDAWTPLEKPGTLELARLSHAVATMARSLEDRATYIRTFASHVSHEFKTPLTAIRGTVELLGDHLDEMTVEERDRFLGNLRAASEQLERLVSRLLDKARADVLRPGDETTDLAAALDPVVRRHGEAGLEVRVEGTEGGPRVRMAEDTLQEIVSSLLDNARQHGGVGVRVRISTRVDRGRRPGCVELVVSDDGAGISEANASRIFTPFFTTARDRGGSGLGLTIVRSLLEAHGGTIELERGTDSGATFKLRLPLAAAG